MRILLVDDDAIVRNSIGTILESFGMQIVATAKDGEEALRYYKELLPDIVLMDIRMDGRDGIWGTEHINKFDPDAKILLLTTFNEEGYINEAIKCGAKGYILKQNFKDLKSAIETVMTGRVVMDRDVLTTAISNNIKPMLPESITDKEREVIELIAEGLNNREISEKLFLSEGTVRNYVTTILDKLDLRDRTQLVVKYLKGELK